MKIGGRDVVSNNVEEDELTVGVEDLMKRQMTAGNLTGLEVMVDVLVEVMKGDGITIGSTTTDEPLTGLVQN